MAAGNGAPLREDNIPDYFEYSKGSEAYKALVRWSLKEKDPSETTYQITLEAFEEGLTGLDRLQNPAAALENIMVARWEKECSGILPSEYFPSDSSFSSDFERFARLSTAMLESIKSVDASSNEKLYLLSKIYEHNAIFRRRYYDKAFVLQPSLLSLLGDQERDFITAAVDVAKASGPEEDCYRTLFNSFSRSRYFLPCLENVDDPRVVSMIDEHKKVHPKGYIESVQYMEFLLRAQQKIAEHELKEIDADTVTEAVTNLSAAMLETRCLREVLSGYRQHQLSYEKRRKTLPKDQRQRLTDLFSQVDASQGHDTPVMVMVFNACVKASDVMCENLREQRGADSSEKVKLFDEIDDAYAIAERVYNNVFKFK